MTHRKLVLFFPAAAIALSAALIAGLPDQKEEQPEFEPDYLDAAEHMHKLRAWPYETIDTAAYERAALEKQLRLSKVRHQADGGLEVWDYVGPKDNPGSAGQYNGDGPVSGRVNDIAFQSGLPSSPIYISSPTGGIHESRDGGTSWTPLSDRWEFLNTSCIAFNPSNSNIMLVGMGDYHGFKAVGAIGVMKGTLVSGNWTWVNRGRAAFDGKAVSNIVFDPETPNVVLASSGRGNAGIDGGGKVFRSTDGGDTWAAVIDDLRPWNNVVHGAINPATGRRLYYAIGGGTGNHLMRSADKGRTWKAIATPISANPQRGTDVATSPTEPDTVYLLSSTDMSIWKSRNGGNTWTNLVRPGMTNGFPFGTGALGANYNWSQNYYDWHMICGTHNDMMGRPVDDVYVGLITLAHSADGGMTWNDIGFTYTADAMGNYRTHNDQHCLAFKPGNGYTNLWVGNDGGIYKTTYDPGTGAFAFSPAMNKELYIAEFYKTAWDVQGAQPDFILGGTQDNGSPWSNASPPFWRRNKPFGDGSGSVIGQGVNNAHHYQSAAGYASNNNLSQGGDNILFFLATKDWWDPEPGFDNCNFGRHISAFFPPLAGDPNNPRYTYTASDELWRYDIDEAMPQWRVTTGGQILSSASAVLSITVAKTDGARVYTGSFDGEVWMTTDAGATGGNWTKISDAGVGGNLPNRPVSGIVVNPANKNQVWISMMGASTNARVARCDDTTKPLAMRQWHRLGGNGLPDIPINCIALDPDRPTAVIFVGTDIGVYMTRDGGATWDDIAAWTLGLPNVQINQLQVVGTGANRTLNAGSYGRGIWRVRINHIP